MRGDPAGVQLQQRQVPQGRKAPVVQAVCSDQAQCLVQGEPRGQPRLSGGMAGRERGEEGRQRQALGRQRTSSARRQRTAPIVRPIASGSTRESPSGRRPTRRSLGNHVSAEIGVVACGEPRWNPARTPARPSTSAIAGSAASAENPRRTTTRSTTSCRSGSAVRTFHRTSRPPARRATGRNGCISKDRSTSPFS